MCVDEHRQPVHDRLQHRPDHRARIGGCNPMSNDARIATGSAGHGKRGAKQHEAIPTYVITTATKHLHEYGILQRAGIIAAIGAMAIVLTPLLGLIVIKTTVAFMDVLW